MERPVAALAAMLHAKRKVRNALTQLRKADVALAQATEDIEQYGHHTCREPADADRVRALVSLALSEHPEVDVVVLIPTTTTRARRG